MTGWAQGETVVSISDFAKGKLYSIKTFSQRVVCDSDFVSERMLDLLDNPDVHLDDEKTRLVQDEFKSKIGIVFVDGRKIAVKRHNYKSWWHRFKRFFRRTRSSRSWYYSRLLLSQGVLVPRPVAFVETRIGPLRGMSYFLYEYVDGITGEEYLKKHADSPKKVRDAIQSIVDLVKKIKELRLIHGDIRVSNLIFKEGSLYLLDLDDMRPRSWYKPARVKNRDVRGLVKDIHYNVPPGIQQLFVDSLANL